MGRHKNNSQIKEKEESPGKDLDEMEVSKLSDTEFRIRVIKMLTDLSNNYKKLNGNFQKLSGNYKKFKEKYISMKKKL